MLAANTFVFADFSPIAHMFEDSTSAIKNGFKGDNSDLTLFLQSVFNFKRDEVKYDVVDAVEEDEAALSIVVQNLKEVARGMSGEINSENGGSKIDGHILTLKYILDESIKKLKNDTFNGEQAEHLSLAAQAFFTGWSVDSIKVEAIKDNGLKDAVIKIAEHIETLIDGHEDDNRETIEEYFKSATEGKGSQFLKSMQSIKKYEEYDWEKPDDKIIINAGNYIDKHTADYRKEKLSSFKNIVRAEVILDQNADVDNIEMFGSTAGGEDGFLKPINNLIESLSLRVDAVKPEAISQESVDKIVKAMNAAGSFNKVLVFSNVDKKLIDALENDISYAKDPGRTLGNLEDDKKVNLKDKNKLGVINLSRYYFDPSNAALNIEQSIKDLDEEFDINISSKGAHWKVFPKRPIKIKLFIKNTDINDIKVDKIKVAAVNFAVAVKKYFSAGKSLLSFHFETQDKSPMSQGFKGYIISSLVNDKKISIDNEDDDEISFDAKGVNIETHNFEVTETVNQYRNGKKISLDFVLE